MQEVRIVLERVFDTHKKSSRSGFKYTTFSFESNGKRFFSVCISGWETIADGTEVIAILKRQNDWQSLAGWIVVPSGNIRTQPNSEALSLFMGSISVAFLFWALTPRPATPRDSKFWWLFEGAFILVSLAQFFDLLQYRQARRTLAAISQRLSSHTFNM